MINSIFVEPLSVLPVPLLRPHIDDKLYIWRAPVSVTCSLAEAPER